MALFAALADIGFSLADRFFPENDVAGFTQPSGGASPPSVTQTTTTDVRVGGPTVSQAVSIGGRTVPVMAPSTAFQPIASPQVIPAFLDKRFEGPTTIQNIPWALFIAAGVAAFAFGKLT